MVQVACKDHLGMKVWEQWDTDDTIRDFKKMIVTQTGDFGGKITLKKWYTVFKTHVSLRDHEIHDRMNPELYYQ